MIKPGVIFGHEYELLRERCREEKYALPAVNVTSILAINACLEAAARNKSDIILQISAGGAAFFAGSYLPYEQAVVYGAVAFAEYVHRVAELYGVCVVLHTDHADSSLLFWVRALIDWSTQRVAQGQVPLFSSHMIDLSAEPIQKNIAVSKEFLDVLRPLEMGLEIELGVTGGEEDGVGDQDLLHHSSLYTQPEDVLYAFQELGFAGLMVAASFGNVHGVYKPGNVHLNPQILCDSADLVNKHFGRAVHFVFHGGSGSSEQEIREAIDYGVFKLNIDTDTQFAFAYGIGQYIKEHSMAFEHQIHPETGQPFKKIYDPRKFLRCGQKGMVDYLSGLFTLLGSAHRSLCL